MNEMYIFWGAAIIVLITIELLTVQLVTVWFALGALCAFFAVMAGAPFWLQLIVFVAVSLIALIATRPLVKKFMVRNIQPTNADRCIGQQALVIADIDNVEEKGQVRIKGAVWSARSKDGRPITEGTMVIIEEIQGVKLIVSALENQNKADIERTDE